MTVADSNEKMKRRRRRRKTKTFIIVVCVVLAIGAAVVVVLLLLLLGSYLRRPAPEPIEVTVTLNRKASAVSNETDLAGTLEAKLATIAGIRDLRSESRASGVKVTCTFDPKEKDDNGHALDGFSATERVRSALEKSQVYLPQGAPLPIVSHETKWANTNRAFVRSKEPIRDKLDKIAGLSILEACGEASYARAPDYVLVRLDLDKLQAMGLGIDDVEETLIQTQMIRMISSTTRDPKAIEGTILREKEPQGVVRLSDVASISLEKRKAACIGLTGAGGGGAGDEGGTVPRGGFVYTLRVDQPLEKSISEQVKTASGGGELVFEGRDDGLVHALVGFPPGATKEQKVQVLGRLVTRMKSELTNLTFYAATLSQRDGGSVADLLFAKTSTTSTTTTATRANIDQLRSVVSREPGVTWRGAFPQKDVKHLEVALRGPELGALATQASDLKKKLEGLKGVLSLVRDSSTTQIAQRRITVDRDRAASLGVTSVVGIPSIASLLLNETEDGSPFLDDIDLMVDHPGVAALEKARVKNVPLTTLVTIEQTFEPESIVRVNRERAVILEWEVEEAHLQAVKKRLENETKSNGAVLRELDL